MAGVGPQHELGRLYYHALACIVPSVAYETFGLVVIEAFAQKTPAIVRDLGALPEVIQESGGGFVYRTDEEPLPSAASLGRRRAPSLARRGIAPSCVRGRRRPTEPLLLPAAGGCD